jgi:hypothetical protein
MSTKKKDLKEFLREEIRKSGFPLEIEVSSILESIQWDVLNNQPFRDPDEGALRSIDVFAFPRQTAVEYSKYEPIGFSPKIILECKKSNSHAWVFFTRRNEDKAFPMDGQVYDFPKEFSTQAYQTKDTMIEKYFFYHYYFNWFANAQTGVRSIHYSNFDRVAIAYQEYKISGLESDDSGHGTPARRNDPTAGRNDILEAINQLVKFQEFDTHESVTSPGRIKGASSPYYPIELSFLAVVFDGKLFEAIPENSDLTLQESKHILLHFNYKPKNSFENLNYFIDIVQKDYFKEYMSKINKDISLIGSKIESEKGKLIKYLKKDTKKPPEPAVAFA